MPFIDWKLKRSYINAEYIKKGLIIYYTNCCWIKYLKLRLFSQMHTCRLYKNLRSQVIPDLLLKIEPTPKKDSWQLKTQAVKGSR